MQGGLFSEHRKPFFRLTSVLFVRYHAGFSSWLRVMNFEPSTVRDAPRMLTEFLYFLEQSGCEAISTIRESHIKNYLDYLSRRPNYKWGGLLSLNSLRNHLQVVRKFSRYLAQSGGESFSVDIHIKGKERRIKKILTQGEIEQLYQATTDDARGMRDRAMLALYSELLIPER